MNRILSSLYLKFNDLLGREGGQDLVEYALVVALIAFGAVISMKGLSTEIRSRSERSAAILAAACSVLG